MADPEDHRLFVDAELVPGVTVTLAPEEAEHAAKSLRLRPGDTVILLNGRGALGRARLKTGAGRTLSATILEAETAARPPGPELCLLAGVVRGPRFDFLIEKATEIGADVIAPIVTRHSEVRPSGREKTGRWHRIIIAAMKQSRRAWLPRLEPVRTLSDWLDSDCENPWVADMTASEGAPPLISGARCHLFVGPEGGWHEEELRVFAAHNATFISLGANRLRSETAAISLLVLARDRLRVPETSPVPHCFLDPGAPGR